MFVTIYATLLVLYADLHPSLLYGSHSCLLIYPLGPFSSRYLPFLCFDSKCCMSSYDFTISRFLLSPLTNWSLPVWVSHSESGWVIVSHAESDVVTKHHSESCWVTSLCFSLCQFTCPLFSDSSKQVIVSQGESQWVMRSQTESCWVRVTLTRCDWSCFISGYFCSGVS